MSKRNLMSLMIAGGMLWMSSAHGFSIRVHLEVTYNELAALSAEIKGDQVGFSERAMEQIADANEAVDSVFAGSAALFRPERHFTDSRYRDSTQRMIDLRQQILDQVRLTPPDGHTARQRLGQALHTIQDFYSHSNWVELGNAGINSAFGYSVVANPPASAEPCPVDPNVLGPAGGGVATSGWFTGGPFFPITQGCNEDRIPEGSCFHGNYKDSCIGINKDLDAVGALDKGVPMSAHHPQASASASEATRVFVQDILDELAGEDRALSALLDARGSMGFVIDDTGSMGPTISGVKSNISYLVNFVSANEQFRPDNYLMVRFGDPHVGTAFVTEDPAAILNAVSAIVPSGGGDCPELGQTGLMAALDEAHPHSRVYFYSDASSKDGYLTNLVIARAQQMGVSVFYVLTGSCSPIDPSYIRIAEETGGQIFFVSPSEISSLNEFLTPSMTGDLGLVLRQRRLLDGSGEQQFAVPVDSTMTGLLVSVSGGTSVTTTLSRPDGSVVSDDDPDSSVKALGTGVVIHVATPEPGAWSLGVDGNGEVSLSVQGNSPVSLDRFAFVEPNPDEDVHGGFFPIPGQPVAGIPGIGEAALLGPVASAGFSMVDLSGNSLGIVDLTQDHPDGNPRHHIGEFELPTVPFRVMARGTDHAGLIYQRLYPVVFRTQPLGVAVLGTNNLDVAPGSSGQLDFLVTNHGGSSMTLNIAASDELGFATDLFPGSLTLAAGEHAEVSVEVTVPEGVDSGTISVLTMTASNINDVSVFNSATAVISVLAEPALDCSPADAMSLQLWPPNHHFAEVDPAALGAVAHDPEMEIAYEIISITQDEPVTGPGSENTAPDGQGIGSAVGEVRAERKGGGNGRVYNVGFRASTAGGGQCESFIRVEVPPNAASEAVDDGQIYASTAE